MYTWDPRLPAKECCNIESRGRAVKKILPTPLLYWFSDSHHPLSLSLTHTNTHIHTRTHPLSRTFHSLQFSPVFAFFFFDNLTTFPSPASRTIQGLWVSLMDAFYLLPSPSETVFHGFFISLDTIRRCWQPGEPGQCGQFGQFGQFGQCGQCEAELVPSVVPT